MRRRPSLHAIPGRLATGAFILHSGMEKWGAPPERAAGLHQTASAAFPVLRSLSPGVFVRLLSVSEVATGSLLLAPFVRNRVAGAALTAFSGALLTMYWRTPAMRREGSIWPSPAGLAVSKDVWMLGIGLGLLADAAGW